MAYEIVIEDERLWRKDFARIPREQAQQILRKIRLLSDEPWPQNIQVKQLLNYELASFRLRVGDYRILFDKNEKAKTVSLLRVLHRSKLY